MVFLFGRHKGKDLEDIPTAYLRWAAAQDWLDERLRDAVQAELDDRGRRRDSRSAEVWRQRAEQAQAQVRLLERTVSSLSRALADQPDLRPPSGLDGMPLKIIESGYRHLALQHHPDHGGDLREMQALNAAIEWLRKVLR